MSFSIIIPVYNEEESIGYVIDEIRQHHPDAEIIVVNDGSTDKTALVLSNYPHIKTFSHKKNLGKGFAICEGLKIAKHDNCVFIDGDGQYDPRDIKHLIDKLKEFDLVCGYRSSRQDRKSSLIVSKIANSIRRTVLQDDIRDAACGIKALKRKYHPLLHPFEGTHRFIASFFKEAGLAIIEVEIHHRPRVRGVTKYTHFGRAWRGIVDLLRFKYLTSKFKKNLKKTWI